MAALLGSAIAAGIGVADTKGIDWVEWLIQIGLAALGVALLDRGRTSGRSRGRSWSRTRR